MPYLFDHFESVREVLARAPSGLFTDVDGTISEIAPSPGEARVSEGCRESLATLARHLEVVGAVSGRSALQAGEMVGVPGMLYIGNHGFETLVGESVHLAPGAEPYVEKVRATLDELARLVPLEGLVFEDKGPTGSVHYRRCRDRESALKAIVSALDGLAPAKDLRVSLGRMVVELRPPLDINKGTAIWSLIEERKLGGSVYLGDDTTDVDVFEAFRRGMPFFTGVSIAVVGPDTSPVVAERADFTVNGVPEVERFLRRLAAEVAGTPGS